MLSNPFLSLHTTHTHTHTHTHKKKVSIPGQQKVGLNNCYGTTFKRLGWVSKTVLWNNCYEGESNTRL